MPAAHNPWPFFYALQRGCRDDLLKNFLLLVLLLDKAAAAHAQGTRPWPKGVPALFDANAPLKSSKEVCFGGKGRRGGLRPTSAAALSPPCELLNCNISICADTLLGL